MSTIICTTFFLFWYGTQINQQDPPLLYSVKTEFARTCNNTKITHFYTDENIIDANKLLNC